MRKEIKIWWDQAKQDFDAALYNFDGRRYYIAAFLCQQAVEKALKALFLKKKKGIFPQSHSLIYLGKEVKAPKEFLGFLRELTPKFVDTRYPDAALGIPAEIYGEENVAEIIEQTKKILKWVKSELEK